MFVAVGQPNAQLGTYTSLDACNNAIRQIFLAPIYPAARNNPSVVEAVDMSIKFQQEYICVKQ
jgi:hypothetical protein